MKKIFKLFLSLVMIAAMVMGTTGTAMAAEQEDSAETIVEKTVRAYFTARADFLETGVSQELSELAVERIIVDETNHRAKRDAAFSKQISVVDYTVSEEIAHVQLAEITENGNISHELTVFKNQGEYWLVVSDAYQDESAHFTSISYISPEQEAELIAQKEALFARGNLSGGVGAIRKSSFLSTADAQEWYLEKASNSDLYSHSANPGNANWTKFGYWGWGCAMEWCAAFVSWCGNQVGLSTSIIPKTTYGSVSEMRDTFISLGRYYTRTSGYTPVPGDIFIQKEGSASHTGIVVSVTASAIYVIDGNGHLYGETYDRVKYQTISRSNVTGYGHPNWCLGASHELSGSYNCSLSNLSSHWRYCSACNEIVYENHTWSYYGGEYHCTKCGLTAQTLPSPDSILEPIPELQ